MERKDLAKALYLMGLEPDMSRQDVMHEMMLLIYRNYIKQNEYTGLEEFTMTEEYRGL